jgi:hypothetical protein
MNARNAVVLLAGFIVAAVLLPISLNQIALATHTNWNAGLWTIFSVVVPILAVVAIALSYIGGVGGGGGGKKGAWTKLKLFVNDKNAKMANTVAIVITLILMAVMFPIGMTSLTVATFNSTTVGAAVYTISTVVLPILVAIGIALKFITGGKKGEE